MLNLQEVTMPPVGYVETNGIRMAVYEAGPETGPAVVLLHGFPELAYSWRRQIPALAAAGYRVIAPDLRGYGLTDRPDRVEDYDLAHLLGDLIGLLDARGIEKAVWVGHDWGGLLAWQLPLFYPERTAGVVGVNTPFVPHWMVWLHPDHIGDLAPEGFAPDPQRDPIEQMREVYSPDMYVLMFHNDDVGDRLMALDPRRTFRSAMRGNMISASDYKKLPPEYRQMALFVPLGRPEPAELPGRSLLAPEELDFYAETFARTGFTSAINWYRNVSRNWRAGLDVEQVVRVPSLMISAADDVILTPGMTDGMKAHIPDLEMQTIADCGHWTPQHKPAELNEAITGWLQRRFPA
ncbi:alpha/beta fold hydrolase [Sphingobium chlorophenolicum]|uniref:Soluble epoxide hydrolase n=1 Tax=Sphingobium chlorophenolicum TaxID=46429 RepID=A0A081RAV0_SPHCR|nr:alpha/beta hydrolase [Sphingobium chlorophenolicum]KEQ52323.1 Soluble epoxide hydrolase [Sphingobium chlorophenolicum]